MRIRTVIAWVLGVLVGLPGAAILFVLLLANTGFGQRLIERETASLTSGQIRMSGLGGRFPDALRLAHLTITDRAGAWLYADGIAVDWSPSAIFRWTALVDTISIRDIRVKRAPLHSPVHAPAPPSGNGFSLPLPVNVQRLFIARMILEAPVIGVPATLAIDGRAHLASLLEGQFSIDAKRLDSPGTYSIDAVMTATGLQSRLSVHEPAGGLVAAAATLPALGPLAIEASVQGPRQNEMVGVAATAGALRLGLSGTIDLAARSAALKLTATAPAMQPRRDVAWQNIDVAAHVTGPFGAPDAHAHIEVSGLSAAGAMLASLRADVGGTMGHVELQAVLGGVRLPGASPELFAAAPIVVNGDVALQAAGRPMHFSLKHPLISVSGSATTQGDVSANIVTSVPDMAPLAALAKIELRGPLTANARIARHGGVTDAAITGSADFTGGQLPIPTLLGSTKFAANASLDGQDFHLEKVAVDGRALHADISGNDTNRTLALAWHISLPDLSAASPRAIGNLVGSGTVAGQETALSVQCDISGDAGAAGFAKAPVHVQLSAAGLPNAPNADLQARGTLLESALTISGDVRSDANGTLHAILHRADWKSLAATADISIAKGQPIPLGTVDVTMRRLDDLSALLHTNLDGALTAKLVSQRESATLNLDGSGLAAGPRHLARIALAVRATGTVENPELNANLNLDGIDAQGVTGRAAVIAQGRMGALNVNSTVALDNLVGAPAKLAANMLVNGPGRQVVLRSLAANWKTLTLRQTGVTRIDVGPSIALDRLQLSINTSRISVAGRISPTMNLAASVQNVTPDLAASLYPGLAADGVMSADAHLTGTVAAPSGHIRLSADNLHMLRGPAAAIPAAKIRATADLNGQTAAIQARMSAGPKVSFSINGDVPLQPAGGLAVRSAGTIDLALMNPVLEAEGRNVTGKAIENLSVGGRLQAPSLRGTLILQQASFRDFSEGLQLTSINASLKADGDTVQISHFSADAGPGTIDLNGSVGVFAAGRPIDLKVTARRARPLVSDLLTAQFDADLTLRGSLDQNLSAAGKILLRRMDINVPESLPPSVAVLHVRQPGEHSASTMPSAPPGPVVLLDMNIDAPSNIFVRGHGLDAELGGKLTVKGSSTAPQIDGGFDLRRGDFSLAGTSLTFSKGSVSFDGTSVTGKIDPTLNFEADSTQGSVTATLKISGYADAPKIALSSVPELPQDEVLAHLLFGESLKQLSPLQIAEIGSALAELSGLTGGSNPLGSIRKGLGLDRLSVGGGTNGAGASVEAGRYVANGVYVGAKQATGGAGGTQAQVQVDLTRHLKLQTTLGTGGGSVQGATPQNDPGSSIGLSYQFEY